MHLCVAITGAQGSIGLKLARFWLGSQVPDESGNLRPLHLKLIDDYEGFHGGSKLDPRSTTVWDGFPAEIIGSYEHCQATVRCGVSMCGVRSVCAGAAYRMGRLGRSSEGRGHSGAPGRSQPIPRVSE